MLPPQYLPETVEKRIAQRWIKERVFEADRPDLKSFTVLMPPPNVTGVLHMGHALTMTLEDILIRRKRMMGFNALWIPGTDHAGIATQMVVEREIQKNEKISRHDLGREKFLERVWKWKEESQETILSQIQKLGSSVDWSRMRFTLDEAASKAVREAFVRLHREGLAYRDEAMVQWCPRCQTALSDLEVKSSPRQGKLWHIRYLLQGDPTRFLTVATTRPETLLGDTAVAVHPEDGRFSAFRNQTVLVPLVNRPIPVIEDSYVDKEFGTGALKITPAHDTNDYQVSLRHRLPRLSIFDDSARINERGAPYQGLSREKAREKILGDLKEAGLLTGETDHVSNVASCDRCQTVVEPKLSRQWFVKADVLSRPAIQAVEEGKIRIVPKEWEKTYFEWMRNIRPWCVSRQLWWGHRIPVWYCRKCDEATSMVETPKACSKCQGSDLVQDEDVLDTWFSSGLWPLSTLGWPNDTDDLKRFYPTDVMETGFDILFFWVARMVMLGVHFKGEVPFHTVYLHPMVRDEKGQKMSKTRGNVKDPLEIIDKKGADALRFTLCAQAVHGRDVLLSDERIEGYRNFMNKLWNATRFVLMHFGEIHRSNIQVSDPINQWILTRLNRVKREVNALFDEYRFFEAAEKIYHFVWNDYCDYFLEFIKPQIEFRKQDSTAVEVLEETVRLVHPIAPFITEELWAHLPMRDKESGSISRASYPVDPLVGDFPKNEERVSRAIGVIESIRKIRGEKGVRPNQEIEVRLFTQEKDELRPLLECISHAVSASRLTLFDPSEEAAFSLEVLGVVPGINIRVLLPEGVVVSDSKGASERLKEAKSQLARVETLLSKPGFIDKAPAAVVEKEREKMKELIRLIESLEKNSESLPE